ncbi:alpha/beta fold hydrolase [Siccirubricoccus sp. G192]|uniref:alpha/beta fold hydrolase n=1 Tax=Siccirubricoccus sp. G192 TaxID=2849651 RepID=UPI001C2BAF59|nr:alpha/beta hydrolase [Siccirubricoccus sp. G192]MBV1798565.1 alpha/beta fold hydrolase [Siccirubricoccus sp. G192]
MPFLDRPGQPRLHYVVDDHTDPWRQAPWLVLQHGYARSGRFFRAWVPYLSRHYRVIRPDLRGFGQSPLDFDPHAGLHPEGLLDDLDAITAMLGEPVHYLGESLAGMIGIRFAGRRPERLRSLALLSSPLSFPAPTREVFACGFPSWTAALRSLGSRGWAERVGAATRFPPGTDPALLRWYAEESGKADVEAMVAVAEFASSLDVTGDLAGVTVPALGLYPSAGLVTGPHEAALRRGIPHLRLVHLPTPYHAIQVLMPAACARTLLHFCGLVDGVAHQD